MDRTNVLRVFEQLLSQEPPSGPPLPPLPPSATDDSGGGMEPRIARLEADMEHIKSEVAKLASMPADLATVKERLSHIPTKSEVRSEVDNVVDRAVKRVQFSIAAVGGIAALVSIGARFIG